MGSKRKATVTLPLELQALLDDIAHHFRVDKWDLSFHFYEKASRPEFVGEKYSKEFRRQLLRYCEVVYKRSGEKVLRAKKKKKEKV